MRRVELGGKARGLINAILRRALREKPALEQRWRKRRWRSRRRTRISCSRAGAAHFGEEATRAALRVEQPARRRSSSAPMACKVTLGELLRSSPGARARGRAPAHARKVRTFPPSWIDQGLCYVQDPSTLLACDLLAPQPGETVLDACAAPGGKTTYLAELMRNEGRIVACDLYESRVERLRENLQRLGVTNAEAAPPRHHANGRPAPAGDLRPRPHRCAVLQYRRPPPPRRCPLAAHRGGLHPHARSSNSPSSAAPRKCSNPAASLVYCTCSARARGKRPGRRASPRANPRAPPGGSPAANCPSPIGVDGAFAAKFALDASRISMTPAISWPHGFATAGA